MGRHGGPLHLLVTLLVAAVALLVAAEAEATLPPPPQASDVDPASPRGPLVIELPYEEGLEDVPAEVRCASWRLAAEANNLAPWRAVPEECADHVRGYVTGAAYRSDLDLVARESAAYARAAAPPCGGDGRDAWVFDVDETLLSNIPYYAEHGSELFDQHAFDEWVERGEAPAIPSSLKLYNEVRDLGFKTFLLTGRSEGHRGVTAENLNRQGFHDWDKLILRCIFTRPTEPNTDQWKKDDNDLQWNSNCTKVSKSSVPGYVIPPRTSQMSAFCTNSGYGQQACIAFPSCPESLISDQKVTIKSPS